MASSTFGQFYNLKKSKGTYKLSHLTTYINLVPTSGSTKDRDFITKSVKSVTISQDSDVIVFNKVIAEVQFVPDDLQFTAMLAAGKSRTKYNFMDHTNQIFNQGSIWYLSRGWFGPKRLQDITSDPFASINTYCTLLKTNLSLINYKYVGTIQFCRRSFQGFRDAVFPIDAIIRSQNQQNIVLVDKDWLLDSGLLNQTQTVDRTLQNIDVRVKTYEENQTKKKEFEDIIRQNSFLVDVAQRKVYTQRKERSQVQRQVDRRKSQIENAQQQLQKLTGKKWRTLRYVIYSVRKLLFTDSGFSILINGLSVTPNLQKQMGRQGKRNYYIPTRIGTLTRFKKPMFSNQILHLDPSDKKTKGDSIFHLMDYKAIGVQQSGFDENDNYVFTDRAATIIDLYAFNKKVYQSNFLQRLANINQYIMPGYPKIRIIYDSTSILTQKNYKNRKGQVITVAWRFPQLQENLPEIKIIYDDANQLYKNFTIQTPTNDQMLRINQINTQASIQDGTSQSLRGIINSIKKVLVPGSPENTQHSSHVQFKHKMYRGMVYKINGYKTNRKGIQQGIQVPSQDSITGEGKRFAGMIRNVNLLGNESGTLYYFSSNQSQKLAVQLMKSVGDKKRYDFPEEMKKQISRSTSQDISTRLISYLRRRLNISFQIHGLFNIPVFRSYVITEKFPGPYAQIDGQVKRWINGRYIITHQSTKIDRTTISTTIKRKRVPTASAAKRQRRPTSEQKPLYGQPPGKGQWMNTNVSASPDSAPASTTSVAKQPQSRDLLFLEP